ncbi:MAG: DNA polymerase III psi subunit [Paraglaciecola sp.]|jgi:DNA polymerase III psi subunit
MEITSHIVLSDYQRAILNEMGISLWHLFDEVPTNTKVENSICEVITVLPEVTSKEDALSKLKQLKVQTQTTEPTDSILVTFTPSETKLQIFTDVLIALGLEGKQQKHISTEQLSLYSDYPLTWTQAEKVSLIYKQLITPALSELQHPEIKKRLWQQLQHALSLA